MESGALRDPAAERAFRRVPRHLFLEQFFVSQEGQGFTVFDHDPERPKPEHLETIYSGAALITRIEENVGTSSSSQPGLMADMLQLLELGTGMRVLEIGAGTGYNAALLAELVGDPRLVTAVDIQEDVVDQARRSLARAGYGGVRVLCRDGFDGAPEVAPFDRIVATVGCPDISPRWVEQLAPSGFTLIPLRHAGANPLTRIWREEDLIVGKVVSISGFMAIQGELRDAAYYDFSQPTAGDGEEERPLWPDLNERRLAFWFYLGLRDRRARMFSWMTSFGLDDKGAGKTARVERDRLAGDPALLDELDALYREWLDLGAADMQRYRLRFTPISSAVDGSPESLADSQDSKPAADPAAPRWILTGRYYRRVFTLPEGQA